MPDAVEARLHLPPRALHRFAWHRRGKNLRDFGVERGGLALGLPKLDRLGSHVHHQQADSQRGHRSPAMPPGAIVLGPRKLAL